MAVQPPDTILLPKSAYELWGTRKIENWKIIQNKNIDIQHLLPHSLLMALQKGCVSFDIFLLFSLLFSNIKFIIIALQIY